LNNSRFPLAGALALAATIFCALFLAPAVLSQGAANPALPHPALPRPTWSSSVAPGGNIPAFARPENNLAADLGPVAPASRLDRMLLLLRPSAAQESALETLLAAQQNPRSPLYHKWLTPAQFGAEFGPKAADLARVTDWLRGRGFTVEEIPAGRQIVLFSGTAAQVEEAFHSPIHRFRMKDSGVVAAAHADSGTGSNVSPNVSPNANRNANPGTNRNANRIQPPTEHIANIAEPEIPAELAGIVAGIVSLDDLRREPASESALRARSPLAAGSRGPQSSQPEWNLGGSHYLSPGDLAAIYDINPLYENGTTGENGTSGQGTGGAGTGIAIAGRSNILLSDVAAFRSAVGLAQLAPTVLTPAGDPGLSTANDGSDLDEATLDVEWAGAVAPAAGVTLVAEASTATTDGIDLASQYIVNHALAPVVSVSFASCESEMGSAELAFYNGLWQQASAQGMSVFVAAGDSGAAGCQSGSASSGSGQAVNGLCSSPYATCVGGTEFNEGVNPAQYWSAGNGPGNASALGYIPEVVWNESGANGGPSGGVDLWATGGGISAVYAQPDWQKNVNGTQPAGAMRAVPDVALTAAAHDGYIFTENGTDWIISGTSAATPSFAAIMALVVEAHGQQGAANPGLYALLGAPENPFHATPSGTNTVPGVTGFAADGNDYNLATGLGSVDANLLVANWGLAGIKASPDPILDGGGIQSAP
jgi:pseudomonalisin